MQELRKAGYQVAGIGKLELHKSELDYGEKGNAPINYHFGYTDPFETEGKMSSAKFRTSDHNSGKPLTGPYQHYLQGKGLLQKYVNHYQQREQQPPWNVACSILEEEDRIDAFIGRKACSFIQEATNEKPWFCSVNFVSPHDPWDASKRFYDAYQDNDFPPSIRKNAEGKPSWIVDRQKAHSSNMTAMDLKEVKRHYAAMITQLDEWVGKITNCINEQELERDTIIIFASDHGEMLGDHGLFRKNVMYESAIRVPLIIVDPTASSTKGTINQQLVELVDLFPTILEMAGIPTDDMDLDGKSITSLLKGNDGMQHKPFQYGQWDDMKMIRNQQFKLIDYGQHGLELYDIYNDQEEQVNLVDEQQEVVRSLKHVLDKLS